ncbi:tRNA 5-hydroxyuridine modification protein YegQ [Alkalimarinus sediminis]|uniref:tRNA 5-hydroxyuridine modification protein YegQ n=1 Tax=Alkalimarinus sediminis TaxID=1632866 RepID=A0A9E8HIJ2_9ALTE|nr:tRNA 5-hydroxyuridine modification protein YegQ [Alkalimarinus sediminis]UZW75300.1 tRNA 5-hydroxyuridine modification protein YegQ [Alkalimarinus sediminis]
MSSTQKPELLAPAGTLKNMKYAFAYGADAVYAGQPRYSLRVRENDFNLEKLEQGIQLAHKLGKKFYVVSNIAPHNSKIETYIKDIEPVIAMKPDALIMSDPGLIMMVRDKWPEQTIHLSVQANAVNYASVAFWQRQGIERVILSRELSLDEIAEIREKCPEMELEVFVHGALCMAYSGRCLLSGYINKRDPNQGTCTNACRWKYQAHEAKEDDAGNVIPVAETIPTTEEWTPEQAEPTLGEGKTTDQVFLLQEPGRPDQLMPAYEDEHGTYIMNSKDLRAVQHVQRFTEMGIHSLKIEGRTKSYYYVARTTQVYRQAIDDAAAGKAFNMELMDDLEKLAKRGYTEGFYRRHVHDEYQNYEQGNSVSSKQLFAGEVIDVDRENKLMTIEVKNRFAVGDSIELMAPGGNITFTLESIINRKNQSVDVAPGSGHQMKLPLPEGAPEDLTYALLMRNL